MAHRKELIEKLEHIYEQKIAELIQELTQKTSTVESHSRTLYANQLFLSKILVRLLSLGESQGVVEPETLKVLWNLADQLIQTWIPQKKEMSLISQAEKRIEQMHRKVARRERIIADQIARNSQRISAKQPKR